MNPIISADQVHPRGALAPLGLGALKTIGHGLYEVIS
jgi:hypothetical protein